MNKRTLAALILISAAQTVHADDSMGNFRFALFPFAIDGVASVEGVAGDIQKGGSELGVVVGGERRFDRWGLSMDFFWGSNSTDLQVSGAESAEFDSEYFIGNFGGMIYLVDGDQFMLDGFLGVRTYMNTFKTEVEPGDDMDKSDNRNWVEPVIGARMAFVLADVWTAELYGDAGGFGVGAGSELSVDTRATIKWQANDSFSLTGGYRVFDMKTERQNGDLQTELNIRLDGPVIGLEVKF